MDERQTAAGEGVHDLRSALEVLRAAGELITTDEPVDPYCEVTGAYRLVGAGVPATPPAGNGPAMLFSSVKDSDKSVLVGALATRRRAALMLGRAEADLPRLLLEALDHPVAPAVTTGPAPCQEVVHRAPLDIRGILPITTCTVDDAGPFITMGLVRASDPETGESDVTIHRMCVQGPDTLSITFVPGRHIDAFREKAEKRGESLPVSVSIGLDPAVYIAACFEPPTTPLGFDELGIAGAVRGRPVELCDCVSQPARGIANAEIVIEGEILPGERIHEDAQTGSGWAMPEFPGYLGASQEVPILRVTAITHRREAIYQAIVCPGEEHTTLAGIPTEASIMSIVERSMPGRLTAVNCHTSGGGKYLAILQFRKLSGSDEGRQRQAALAAFAAFSELKHVILVDEDVDIFTTDDVLWAMTTRYQGDVSTVFVPGVRCHPLDPTQSPEYNPMLRGPAISCKTIFDCTVPYAMREQFRRPRFADVDLSRFLGH